MRFTDLGFTAVLLPAASALYLCVPKKLKAAALFLISVFFFALAQPDFLWLFAALIPDFLFGSRVDHLSPERKSLYCRLIVIKDVSIMLVFGVMLPMLRRSTAPFGLMLLFAVKVLLWMLPGMAVMFAGFFLPDAIGGLAMAAGIIASIVMGIRAAYRYAMVTFVMADDPTTTIRGCFRRSCEVMQRRKLELFSLEISFIGWHLLLSLVQSMLMGFGVVIGLTLGMFASLFLTVYTNCAHAAFYQEYAVGPVAAASAEAETDELND